MKKQMRFTCLTLSAITGLLLLSLHGCKKEPKLPTLTTLSVTEITATTAVSGGNITDDGGAAVSARGIVWGTASGPTLEQYGGIFNSGGGTGLFTAGLEGLSTATPYYVRAFASNKAGTAYGDQVIFTTAGVEVGEAYGGGIVAYLFQSGDPGYVAGQLHGIIAAPADQGSSFWGCHQVLVGGTATAIGSGPGNTTAIVTACADASCAARISYNAVLFNRSDWVLPGKDELNVLYVNRNIIGGFTATDYWSSSEVSDVAAWKQNFSTGLQGMLYKNNTYRIRSIRYF
jgi:hypothetical protein